MLQRLSWTFKQRERADRLRVSLEAHKSALDIALELGAITQLHELQIRTKSIKHDTVALRASFAIVEAMAEQVQAISLHVQRDQDKSNDPVLAAFLADVAAYAQGDSSRITKPDRPQADTLSAANTEIARLRTIVRDLEEERDQIAAAAFRKEDENNCFSTALRNQLQTIVRSKQRRLEEARQSIERHNSQLNSSVGSIALAMTTDPNSELGIRRTSVKVYNQMYEGMAEDLESEVMLLSQMGGWTTTCLAWRSRLMTKARHSRQDRHLEQI